MEGPSMRSPRSGQVALLAFAAVSAAAADASALPIRVRSRTVLEVRVERRDEGLLLGGTLADDGGRPLPREAIHVEVEGLAPRTVLSGADGRIEVLVTAGDARDLADGGRDRVPWTFRYEGGASYGPARATGVLDLEREPSWVEVVLDPAEASLDDPSVSIRVRVGAGSGPVGRVPVRVRVAEGPELVGETDPGGEVVFLLHPDALGREGASQVVARFPGDHRFAPSEGQARLRVLRPTRLTLRVGREGDLVTGRYRFSGRLIDDRGPLAGLPIAIVTRGAPAAGGASGPTGSSGGETETLATTDEDGVFLVAVDIRDLAGEEEGTADVRAVFQPQDGIHHPAQSRPARIPIPGPPGVPARWYFASVVASLGLVLLALAVRMRFWEDLRRLWAMFRTRREDARRDASGEPPLVVARGTARTPRRDVVAGQLVDAHAGRGLGGALVSVVSAVPGVGPGGVRLETTTGEGGAFDLGPFPAGLFTLSLSAPGYLRRETAISLPHDGSLDGATLALVSIRGRVRDLFQASLGRLHAALRWGHDTPREALAAAHLPAEAPGSPIGELLGIVEGTWFGPDPPTPEDAERAERLARSLEERG